MNTITRSLPIILTAITLVACSGPTSDAEVDTSSSSSVEAESSSVSSVVAEDSASSQALPTAEEVEDDLQKLILFYGTTVCMVADPNFWDGFFEDETQNGWIDTSTPEGAAADAERYKLYLQNFGYTTDAEVEADLVKYRGRSALVSGVALVVEQECPGLIEPQNLQVLLDSLK